MKTENTLIQRVLECIFFMVKNKQNKKKNIREQFMIIWNILYYLENLYCPLNQALWR